MAGEAFQDRIPDNLCFGCGPDVEGGLRIKSHWEDGKDDEAVCTWQPLPHHAAGPPIYLNGGIIATLIDCHAICTAIAHAYRLEARPIGSAPQIWCATASLELRYLRPAPLAEPVQLRARILGVDGRRTRVACELGSGGASCAEAEVAAVRVSEAWRRGG